jgi:hypothetical protein
MRTTGMEHSATSATGTRWGHTVARDAAGGVGGVEQVTHGWQIRFQVHHGAVAEPSLVPPFPGIRRIHGRFEGRAKLQE